MLHAVEREPKKIERTIKGWCISLEGDYIRIVTPSGTFSKIHINEPIPFKPLISKETEVLTKNGMQYKTIKLIGPDIPVEVKNFIRLLQKAIPFR